MKKMILVMALLMSLFGCASQKDENVLVIGVDDTFAPMGFRDEKNELVGFDIDLATLLLTELGYEFEFQPIDWSMKETELNAKNIDLIWNGYTITDKRKEVVNFSTPYLANRQIIVVLSDSNINSKEDLAGKVVSVQKDSSALDAVMSEEIIASSLDGAKPIEFDTNIECIMDLEAKRSDAIVLDEVLARYVLKERGIENYRILEDNFGSEEYGIGVRKEDTDLLNNINRALEESMNDGSFNELYQKWFAE